MILLPLVLLSVLLGLFATLFLDTTWIIASFVVFILILAILQTVDVIGGAIIAIHRKLTKDKGKQEPNQSGEGTA